MNVYNFGVAGYSQMKLWHLPRL